MKRNVKYIIGGALVIALGLIWIGGGENRELQSVSPIGDGGYGSTQIGTGSLAPDFSLETLNGETIVLSSYIGEKPVILDFWASWCPNCRRDMPRLSLWYEQYKDEIEVIGINLQERSSVAEQYVKGANIAFPIVLDPQALAAQSYGVRFTNYHVLIGKDGTIAGFVPGDINEAQILSLIAANESSSSSERPTSPEVSP